MLILLGSMTAIGGLFLLLWYRTLSTLPARQKPHYSRSRLFRWGIPLLAGMVFVMGIFLLGHIDPWLSAGAVVLSCILAFLVLKFDRYTADMRLIHDHYQKVRAANPEMETMEVLYHTAEWRYPKWNHDRLVELVAGKDIESLILLMVINENEINPIADWELYRSLKIKASRVAQSTH